MKVKELLETLKAMENSETKFDFGGKKIQDKDKKIILVIGDDWNGYAEYVVDEVQNWTEAFVIKAKIP